MTTMTRESVLKPGLFGVAAAADSRRYEFDSGNEELLLAGVRPDVVFIGDSITHLWEVQAYFGGSGAIGMLQHDLADDGIHPHAYGYTIMSRVLRETLAKQGITL